MVGADLRVCPGPGTDEGAPVGADLRVCPDDRRGGPMTEKKIPGNRMDKHIAGEHTGSPLHRVIQWETDRENPYAKINPT